MTAPHPPVPPVRVVYTDLDGTMLGHMGSFFHDDNGLPTLAPAAALLELYVAGVPLVLVSGRTRVQLREAARLFGADGFVAELGGVIGWDHGFSHETVVGAMPVEHGGRLPAEVLDELGVVAEMQSRWPGRVEWHSPWHTGRETDAMVRGRLDLGEVTLWLRERWSWLALVDNGLLPAAAPPPGVASELDADAWPPRVYHLMPTGVSKGTGVAVDLARRGLSAQDAIAIGDSVSDLEMAAYVRELWLVANGAADPDVQFRARGLTNVRVASLPLGAGWAEAVRHVLGLDAH